MNVLAVDQARHGAWSVFDYEEKRLVAYGTFSFENKDYDYAQAILQIESLIDGVINAYEIAAVFFEDIQLRKNVAAFKKLAHLQGVLINLCEKNEYLYGLITPSQWQNYCGARGRTDKERRAKLKELGDAANKTTKELSIEAVKRHYGIDTDNDNLADAIMMGHYVVEKVKIET
jgi:Holliday junction resolvasome RuvABC endonuclease subunit